MNTVSTAFTSIVCILLTCCICNRPAIASTTAPETVMTEGMRIRVTNSAGGMTIIAGKGYERSYTWEGATRSQILIPRTERFAGKSGIGKNGSIEFHNGITRAALEEAQYHFSTLEEALAVLNHSSRMDGFTVYNDEGLMVTWKKLIRPDQYRKSTNVLMVGIYQIYINGTKPAKLPGSQNEKIVVDYKKSI